VIESPDIVAATGAPMLQAIAEGADALAAAAVVADRIGAGATQDGADIVVASASAYIDTSATGGYVLPLPSAPPVLDDDALEDFLQAIIVGVTGMPGSLVIPFWQLEPPNLPAVGTNWASFGIEVDSTDTNAVIIHHAARGGAAAFDELQRHEILDVEVRMYGPQARANMHRLRDGLQVAQNREALSAAGMGLIETTAAKSVPALVKERWLFALVSSVRIRRQVIRYYPILDLASVLVDLETDGGLPVAVVNVS